MKKDIIIAGVGGQGILSIAAVIDLAAIKNKLFVKQAEVHGMSQRGGAVQTHLRISDQPIFSDLISKGKADLIISIEPMESLRYLEFLKPDGWVVSNINPIKNISNYPDTDKILNEINHLPYSILADADTLAKQAGSIKASNMVLLGVASEFFGIDYALLKKSITEIFGRKGEDIIQMNLRALEAGRQEALKVIDI
ncbi:MAG: indolepyruvate oxidoreductase subunit beta [Bacteroidales bacterium]|nr:indolepyruvate oxidoreductase subunit beta [Bacteroidales bacterium]